MHLAANIIWHALWRHGHSRDEKKSIGSKWRNSDRKGWTICTITLMFGIPLAFISRHVFHSVKHCCVRGFRTVILHIVDILQLLLSYTWLTCYTKTTYLELLIHECMKRNVENSITPLFHKIIIFLSFTYLNKKLISRALFSPKSS